MTDRQYPPRKAGPPGSATIHHGPDPQPHGENEAENKPKLPVNVIQISASAGAAVTSAVAASFFGVGGTLAGAAFGSIVSSVAGALYQESLNKAKTKVVTATAVVVQRFPGDVPQADSIRRMTGPAGVPAPDSLNRVGWEDTERMDVEHVQVPIGDETQQMGWHHQQLDATRPMPPVPGNGHTGSAGYQSSRQPPPPPSRRSAQREPERPQSWWRRPGFIMAGISMAGFLIALFFIVGTESVIGHPISGGDGGTTLTRLTSNNTKSTPEETPSDSGTPTPTPTATGSATPSATDSATTTPTESAAPDATATTDPTSTDSATTDGGSSDGQSTDQSTDPSTDQPLNTEGDSGAGTDQGLSQSGDGGDTGADGQAQAQSTP